MSERGAREPETREPRPRELFRPLPVLRLLDLAVKQTRAHFWKVFPGTALPLALAATAWLTAYVYALAPAMTPGGDPTTIFNLGGCTAAVVLFALYLAVQGLASNAMSVAAVDALRGRPVEVGACWRFLLEPAALGTLILALVLIGVSLSFCLVPALVVYPLLAWVVPVMREEGARGLEAFSRSTALARHYPKPYLLRSAALKILLTAFVGLLLSYAANMMVTLPFQMVQVPLQLRQATGGGSPDDAMLALWLSVPANFLGTLAASAVTLYVRFTLVLLYFDTRGRSEGNDLEEAVEELERAWPAPRAGEPA